MKLKTLYDCGSERTLVSKKLYNDLGCYHLCIQILDMREYTGDEYFVGSIISVSPDAVSPEKMKDAYKSCGINAEEKIPHNEQLQCLIEYGIYAPLFSEEDESPKKLLRVLRRKLEEIALFYGFYMDKQVNAIGNDGWDFISGKIGFKK